jgi:hypothetical protein
VIEAIVAYGDDPYDSRSELHGAIWEISAGLCEHPVTDRVWMGTMDSEDLQEVGVTYRECSELAAEMAHIKSIGMGGRKTADTVNNTIAACEVHARSTDDLSSPEWQHVPPPHDLQALTDWICKRRRGRGWAL